MPARVPWQNRKYAFDPFKDGFSAPKATITKNNVFGVHDTILHEKRDLRLFSVVDHAAQTLRLARTSLDVAVTTRAYERFGAAWAFNPFAPGVDHLLFFFFDFFVYFFHTAIRRC